MRGAPVLLAAMLAPLGAAAAGAGDGARPAAAAATPAVPDFATEVLPLMTRIGCNSGGCHGASGGQAGFALSLRGHDPVADYDAIARDRGGRRVDLADSARSLLLRKPSMQVPHKGGRKLPRGGERYEIVHRWIEAGAPPSTSGRAVVRLDVEPAARPSKPGDEFALKAIAAFDDGSRRDVTSLALFSSGVESVAAVTPEGKVAVAGPGETAVLVRFLNQVASARVTVPFGEPYAPADRAGISKIDRLIEAKCAAMGIPISPPADDATFLRRVALDLIGRLPSVEETRAFFADGAPGRRERAIDRWLRSKELAVHWARWLADLARVRKETMTEAGAASLQSLLRQSIEQRRPVVGIVRKLILGEGDPALDGAAAFPLATLGPKEQMEHVTRSFLGIRLACAQCHPHPFDRWTRDDYYGAASFFARVRVEESNSTVVLENFGELTDPRTGGDARAKLPGGKAVDVSALADRREAFADWMLDREGMRVHRAMANRLWKQLFGRGIVEPVDDLRDANPASNPELLDAVATILREAPGDLVAFLAVVVRSEAYARSCETVAGNEHDLRYFSHAIPRPLSAAVALDAIADATGASLEFPDDPRAKRAVEVTDEDGGSYSLKALGTCPRDGSRDPATIPPPSVPAALHLLHGPPSAEWLLGGKGRIASMLERKLSTDDAVREMFLATLCRAPSAAEMERARAEVGPVPTRMSLGNVLWALLATTEFAFNH